MKLPLLRMAACVAAIAAQAVPAAELSGDARAAFERACADVPPIAAAPAQIESWMLAHTERALGAACGDDRGSIELALHAVDALLNLSRTDAARDLLQALPSPTDTDPWRGHWHMVHGLAARIAGLRPLASQHLAAARAAMQTNGEQTSRRFARVLSSQGVMWRNAGEFDLAEGAAAEAERLLGELGLAVSAEAADVLNLRTVLAHSRQNLPDALRFARAEIDMLRALGLADDPEAMHAWASVGGILSQLGRHDESIEALRQGLRLIGLHPDRLPYGQLGVLQNLVGTYLALGRGDDALVFAERALAKAAAAFGADSPRQVRPLMLVATSHATAARHGAALLAYQRAQALAQRQQAALPAHTLLELTDGIAAAQLQLGESAAARATLHAGLDSIDGRRDFDYWRGRLLRRLALIDAREARWSDVEARQAEAAALIGAVIGPAHPYVIEMHAERCVAQLRQGVDPLACALLDDAVPTLSGHNPSLRFRVQAALAQREDARGATPETTAAATTHHVAALAAAEAAGTADPRWSALDALARHLRAQKQAALAVYFGKQSIAAIEQLRTEVAATVAQAERGFLIDKVEVYRRVAEWLAEDGRIDEALDTLRLLKEEEFFDYVQRDGRLADGEARMQLSTAERRLDQRWQRLREAASAAADEAAWAVRARATLAAMAAEMVDAAARRDATASPSAARPAEAPVAPGELHVHAISGEDHLTLVFDGEGARHVRRLAWPRAALGREVGTVLSSTSRRDTAPQDALALFRRLGEPIADAALGASAQRIVLRLDGALRYVPMAALQDASGELLSRRFVLEHRVAHTAATPSVTTYAATPPVVASAAAPRVMTSAARPLVVSALGVTRATAGWRALPGVADEVCAIVDGPVLGLGPQPCAELRAGADVREGAGARGAVTGAGWMNEHFTAARMRLALRPDATRLPLLHVGTHFDLRPGNIERSSLLLGDGSKLSLAQLAALDFDGQHLVTLSACETGVGGADGADGREVEGLNLVILRRGAGTVLASLWRVDDASTSRLMAVFYRELERVPAAVALQRAQEAVRSAGGGEWRSPFHWAGFYVTSRQP